MTHTNSPQTAAAIGAAMESACASGDLEAAERLFECFRLLFVDYQDQASIHYVNRPIAPPALSCVSLNVIKW